MKGIARRRDRARQDLIAIFRHLAREAGVRTAGRFFAQAEATFERLAAMPHMGTRYEAENPAFAESPLLSHQPLQEIPGFLPAHRARRRYRPCSSQCA
jgi:plasmid stabilization system protein ParE